MWSDTVASCILRQVTDLPWAPEAFRPRTVSGHHAVAVIMTRDNTRTLSHPRLHIWQHKRL